MLIAVQRIGSDEGSTVYAPVSKPLTAHVPAGYYNLTLDRRDSTASYYGLAEVDLFHAQ